MVGIYPQFGEVDVDVGFREGGTDGAQGGAGFVDFGQGGQALPRWTDRAAAFKAELDRAFA